jgi:hypothetical protein
MGLQSKSTLAADAGGTVTLKLSAAEARTLLSALNQALGSGAPKAASVAGKKQSLK